VTPANGPAYPGDDDGAAREPSAPAMGWGGRIAIATVAAVVVLIVVLHLTGAVGPAAH